MNTGTILIVDDNKGVLASLELLLENYFSKILTASNPNQITALLTTRRIDVVILDMNFSAGINNGNEGQQEVGCTVFKCFNGKFHISVSGQHHHG